METIYQTELTIWEGKLDKLPLRKSGEIVLPGKNRYKTPIPNILTKLTIRDNKGNEVSECENCIKLRIPAKEGKHLVIEPKGPIGVSVKYDINIMCNGILNHNSSSNYSLVLQTN